jgi:sn-glycerol 3-phosphate transport system substrate-binding protein
VKPVYQLMKETGEPFDPKAYLPTVTGYYSDVQGNMLSLPFNSSTALFYIDRNKFKAPGLPPVAPKTWKELVAAAEKLKAAGQDCVYTSGWPSWVHVENFSAWHNVPIGTRQNGMGGLDAVFTINSPIHVKHVEMLADMVKRGLFSYAGRTNQADAKFQCGECAMATISAGALGGTIKAAKTDWQLNFLPYHDDVPGAPQNSIIGGASLWVMSGRKAEEYKGVARFFSFLSRPEVQMEWHTKTGYVPITLAAYELTRKSGFYDKNPGRDTAVLQLTNKPPTENSKGLRFGNFVQGRTIIEEELEAAFAGKKTAKAALDDAVRRGNELLRQFEAANK